MKLSSKFLILGVILFLTVAASFACAYWAVRVADSEIRSTYGEISIALDDVDAIKVSFDRQSVPLRDQYRRLQLALADPARQVAARFQPLDQARRGDFEANRLIIDDRIRSLEASARSRERIGDRIYTFILNRSDELQGLFQTAIDAWERGEPEDVDHFVATMETSLPKFEELHTLIENLERRLLADLETALEHGDVIRATLNRILLTGTLIATLVAALGWLLLQRWVAAPIDELRRATLELSDGHFDYRIPVRTSDEFGVLSDEVNEMATTIVEMQSRLIERERLAAVGEMMRRIVHNLRNPLAGIRTLAELTRSDASPDSDAYENQTRILSTVDRFERWLNEVLQSTAPLEVRPEPGRPRDLVEGVVETHRPSAEGKSIDIEIADGFGPESAEFDARHLQHALAAIIANAIEATPPSGRVRVSVRADAGAPIAGGAGVTLENSGEWWEIRIEDSGEGVPEESHDRIFEPYFTTKRHGSGIGLAVARNVIQAHGGHVRVDRSELGGAAFIITLRRRPLAAGDHIGQNCDH